jgi:hypothetical protein
MQKGTKTARGRKEREDQQAKHNLGDLKDFPKSACLKCFHLSPDHHCRQKIYVSDQEVGFLRGHGITMAPEGERMAPGAVCEIIRQLGYSTIFVATEIPCQQTTHSIIYTRGDPYTGAQVQGVRTH